MMLYRFHDPYARQLDDSLLRRTENKYLCLTLAAYILSKLFNEDFNNPKKRYLWEQP